MRALRFLGINLVWFTVCFASFFFLDKAERNGAFIWHRWHVVAALVAVTAIAFLIARLHDQMKPARGPVSLSYFGCTFTLIVNALLSCAVYAVAVLFIYGE